MMIRRRVIFTAILLGIATLPFRGSDWAQAQIGLDFEVPEPPNSESAEAVPLTIGAREIMALPYRSQDTEHTIASYYQRFFKEEGFQLLSDEQIPQLKDVRKLRFKKEDLVVDVILTPTAEGTDVGILKYLQREGEPALEESRMSINDSFISLPKEDMPGEDLRIVPRPPESIRLVSHKQGRETYLTYMSPLSLEELRDFYKLKMPYQAWQIKQEIGPQDRGDIAGNSEPGPLSPFIEGADFNELVKSSYALDYAGRYGSASITIMYNCMDKKLGSIVQIIYEEP